MKRVLLLLLVALTSFSLCEAQSKTKFKTKKTSQGRIMWRLRVDFISKGAGIDEKTYQALINHAASHPKKPTYNVVQKGKEGEKQVYFGLAELSEDEQYKFVGEVNSLVRHRELVRTKTTLPRSKIPAVTTVGATTDNPVAVTGQSATKYRLIVTFTSKGEGIDSKAQEKFMNLLANHPKKPSFQEKSWGREGEKDYLLTLKELNSDEQKVFVADVKKLVSNSDMIFIKENEAHSGRGR